MTNESINVESIRQWHEMALQGRMLPIYIPINGISMMPLIRRNRDRVCIVPANGELRVGDIVLFADPYKERRYVLHRLWRIEADHVVTWGDNCDRPDRAMSPDCIWGKAILINRGRMHIKPHRHCGMLLARCRHLYRRVGKRVRKLLRLMKVR